MTTSEQRYDGSACLNVRSVTMACRTLGSASTDQPLAWEELENVLWFVETCVTSRRLYFDGTVPRKTASEAVDQVSRLKSSCDVPELEIAPIVFDSPGATLAAAKDAAAESRLLLENFQLRPEVDRPLGTPEHDRFYQQLKLGRTLTGSARSDLLIEWVSDAFTGSKCLAAIVANGDEMVDAALNAYAPNVDGALVTAALMNRFRLNYVNELAARRRSVYVPDPAFEVLTTDHVRLFKDYLLGRVLKQLTIPAGDSNTLVENMNAESPLPPIGLYALMATRGSRRPAGILETAFNEFRADDGLMKLVWRNTLGGMSLRKDGMAEAALQEIDAYFYDHYKTLEKEAAGIKIITRNARKARTYLIPAILKGLAQAIPAALGVDKLWNVLYSIGKEAAVEFTIPWLGDRLLADGCDSYISQYQNLKWNLQNEDAVRQPLANLADHVERVFGRKLADA
jgi:hypothetical protein